MNVVFQKVVVNCDLSVRSESSDVAGSMERFVRSGLLPLIEDILSESCPFNRHICLNEVSLSLPISSHDGSIDGVNTELLKDVLRQQILGNIIAKGNDFSIGEMLWQQFVFMSKNGFAPWNFKYADHAVFEQRLLLNLSLLHDQPEIISELKALFLTPGFIKRIAANHSLVFIIAFLKSVYKSITYRNDEILADLSTLFPIGGGDHVFKKKLFILSIAVQTYDDRRYEVNGFLFEQTGAILSVINPDILKSESALFMEEVAFTLQTWLDISSGKVVHNQNEQDLINTCPKINNETAQNLQHASGKEILVRNAGIVLLANFLPNYFQQLGLIERGLLRDKVKGAFLLQLLCGAGEYEEYYLPLNKILCGFKLSDTLNAGPDFTNEDVNETNLLLKTVIEHWTSLKNTSVGTLQHSFFRRPGKLYFLDDQVILQVEKRTEDVLLDYLPWSFSVIKLSWMDLPLTVQWI